MAFCSKCGNQIDDDAKFCNSCGAKNGDDMYIISIAHQMGYFTDS